MNGGEGLALPAFELREELFLAGVGENVLHQPGIDPGHYCQAQQPGEQRDQDEPAERKA